MADVSSTSGPVVPPCVPGPSGLQADTSSSPSGEQDLHAVTSSALEAAGGGESTSNGSSDTPKRPRKRPRRPENWKKNVAKAKRAKGEAYVSPSTGKHVKLGQPANANASASMLSLMQNDMISSVVSMA